MKSDKTLSEYSDCPQQRVHFLICLITKLFDTVHASSASKDPFFFGPLDTTPTILKKKRETYSLPKSPPSLSVFKTKCHSFHKAPLYFQATGSRFLRIRSHPSLFYNDQTPAKRQGSHCNKSAKPPNQTTKKAKFVAKSVNSGLPPLDSLVHPANDYVPHLLIRHNVSSITKKAHTY